MRAIDRSLSHHGLAVLLCAASFACGQGVGFVDYTGPMVVTANNQGWQSSGVAFFDPDSKWSEFGACDAQDNLVPNASVQVVFLGTKSTQTDDMETQVQVAYSNSRCPGVEELRFHVTCSDGAEDASCSVSPILSIVCDTGADGCTAKLEAIVTAAPTSPPVLLLGRRLTVTCATKTFACNDAFRLRVP